jgi:hypothetical protein
LDHRIRTAWVRILVETAAGDAVDDGQADVRPRELQVLVDGVRQADIAVRLCI